MEFYVIPWKPHALSREFHGILYGLMDTPWSSMEFHGNLMDLRGVSWNHHGISMEVPWNICGHCMGALNTEFHGM